MPRQGLLRLKIALLGLLSVLVPALRADIRPLEGTVNYEAESDYVILGRVISTGVSQSGRASALVHPERVYKGSPSIDPISVTYPSPKNEMFAEIRSGELVLMFLHRADSTSFEETRPGTSFVHDVSKTKASSGHGRDALIADLLDGVHDASTSHRVTSLQVLSGFSALPHVGLATLHDSPSYNNEQRDCVQLLTG
jgi:hypothetical protein